MDKRTKDKKNQVLFLGIQEIKTIDFISKLDKAIYVSSPFMCEPVSLIGQSVV